MSETELQILRETQQILDERLKLLDAEMAHFAGLSAPTRAIETESWFRKQITQVLEPSRAHVEKLENQPAPAPTRTTVKPPQEFIGAIGRTLHDEIEPL